jgi:hypothetical protein
MKLSAGLPNLVRLSLQKFINQFIKKLFYCFAGLEPKRYRCQIPICDKDDFQFSDLANDTNENIFPTTDDGGPDYCRFLQNTVQYIFL